MSHTNTFLAKTINPSLLKASDPTKPVTVHFDGDHKAILDPTVPGAKAWRELIDYLQHNDQPVYVEIDASGVITQLSAPSAERVWEIDETDDETVYVSFHTSTALLYLRRSHPGFQEMLRTLKQALEQDATVLVTSANLPQEIIDVRELPPSFKRDVPVASSEFPDDSDDPLTRVTPEKALELFKKIAAISCIPVFSASRTGTCIPFRNPANGCWVRAHLMAWILVEDEKVIPGKIWSTGKDLHTHSTNVPNCIVKWGWHVAATVMVIYPDGREEKVVFDPSMFDRPVSVDEWKIQQTDPKIKVSFTSWEWFRFGVKDVSRPQANEEMEKFRNELKVMWEKYGPPPYKCPPDIDTN